ncbi:hypothetical protein J5N97_004653 [Dioscorea zingiberensis]|uniref:Lactate/malate dehydrogenase N-terminal domain-containing protein n=1 Tax=Dioscorea zingiberensis TaxID=325984 RepID=A0A9D5HSD5_9LILI|nr:hypothetical protein J5N97_004653 [Dioscorea zingiberensis]
MKLAVEMRGYNKGMMMAEEVETRVRWLMESDGGKELREWAKKMKDHAATTLSGGGSSHVAIVELIRIEELIQNETETPQVEISAPSIVVEVLPIIAEVLTITSELPSLEVKVLIGMPTDEVPTSIQVAEAPSPTKQRMNISVIGTRNVGMAITQTILAQDLVDKLALLDAKEDKFRREMVDLQHSAAFLPRTCITADIDYAVTAGSDL